MDEFKYYKGQTSVDDIIEHILMRLNTDFKGASLLVIDFCTTSRHDYDSTMVLKVIDKMYKHRVAEKSDGNGQSDSDIMLTAQGANVFDAGGWKLYLDNYEKQLKIDQEKKDKPSNQITIHGSVTGSQLGLSSDFGNLESSHNSMILDPTEKNAQPKKDDQKAQELSILSKIYKWTDHKLISGIILLILGFYISRLFIWLNLLPCP